MRIGGLASGMDIDQIVKDLMKAERMPLDKLKQKKQILEWQRDDFRSINTKLLSFRDKLANLKLTPNYRARTTTTSNEAYVTATATSGASQAAYSISAVSQLATAATRVNTGAISADPSKKIDVAASLYEQKDRYAAYTWEKGVVESKTIQVKEAGESIKLDGGALKTGVEPSVKVNGQSLKVVTGSPSAGQVKVESDGSLTFGTPLAAGSSVKVEYVLEQKSDQLTIGEDPVSTWSLGKGSIDVDSFTLNHNGTEYQLTKPGNGNVYKIGTIGEINVNTGVITFDSPMDDTNTFEVEYTQNYSTFSMETHTSKGIVNETFFITGNESLNGVMRKVNESTAGVTMFYDSFKDQVTLTRKETGDFNLGGNEMALSGDFLNKFLKFEGSAESGGSNAKLKINGLDTERSSNTFEMNGVTFTLKQTFLENTITPVTVSVNNDTDKVLENIKGFVESYNELIAEISKKLNEEKHRSYKPLTDDEREGLSEKQIEKWEEMARSGLLKNDPLLSNVLSGMRMDISNSVETNGLFKQLASIGIKTTANYLDGGKLQIDEAKLKEALEKDLQPVENLFRGDGVTSGRGVVHKLYDTVDATMKKLQEKAGRATSTNQQFALGRQLLDVDKSIDRFDNKMKQVENRYWRQFTAMEKAIQRANNQSMYLMQQFGNM